MSKLNLGTVKAFNVMKTCFGGFEDVGASKVEFKNYKRQVTLFIGEYDAEMVGVRLCNSTNFKERICGVVWTDILTPEEFEPGWEEVIGEFNLADNDWLSDIFELRESWIPAYNRMEELLGLMRTTSRSENENHFSGQVCNSKATLVEFITHYETTIEAQRHTHHKNDHESRYKCPRLKTELIGIADCINQRYEDQPDSCCVCFLDCLFYTEILCMRYIDIVFGVFREFPKQYILNRWRKEAYPNCSFKYSTSPEYMTELDPDVQSMINKDELSLYKDHVQSYMKNVQDMQIVAPPPSTRDRFAEITGQYKNDKNPIRVFVGYKSKGSGSRKRLKSKQKVAIEKTKSKSKPGAKERQCQNCKGNGHNASTCKKAVIKRKSTSSSRASKE
ncbi:protein FAR1-RELATED SEQUENCE 3-like [Helianthus annuus]|uniref:protein FAR1-RELATED SEQUENCE 3-like n=1 Tax=Helianthus annuus TaxID=4232 RepID=UPI000B8EF53D|nr:protein FAR1-RELATED SEQUENCE 3-like [Helianthus annuus]